MKRFLFMTLLVQAFNTPAFGATLFLESGPYELISKGKSAREHCPEGQFMEITDGGSTQLILGPNIVIQLSPLKSKEVVPGGCTYERETKITKSEVVFTTIRSKCKEAGTTVERLIKSGTDELTYKFTGPKKKAYTCKLKKVMQNAEAE